MICKLTEENRIACMELLKCRPAENLFLIGDIENFGFNQDFQEIWGQWDNGKLIAILLRYEMNAIIYAEADFDVKGFATLIKELPVQFLSGLDHLVELVEQKLDRKVLEVKKTFYAKYSGSLDVPLVDDEVKIAIVDDLDYVYDLLVNVPEFMITRDSIVSRKRTLETKTGRTLYIEKDGKVVSTASSTAENSLSAMVVTVATHIDYKGRGYGTKIVSELTKQLVEEGKECCLFYDNPVAGQIYKRIGYKDIGFWRMDSIEELK